MSNTFLTFDEATGILNVSNSTLYRWLREGKVPGHKVGRQWRFRRDELESFMVADGPSADDTLAPLATYLSNTNKENIMDLQALNAPAHLAEALLWDALDKGAHVVHLQPHGAGHSLRYRTSAGLNEAVSLPSGSMDLLDSEWRKASQAVRSDDHRRLFLEREHDGEPQRVQVTYQRLQTLEGTRLTLRLLPERYTRLTIDDIATGDDAETLRWICSQSHGIVLFSGRSGSGKTTTAYVCLAELARSGDRAVFTIEDSVGPYLPGVNQVEIDLDDPSAYRATFSTIEASDPDVLFLSSPFSAHHRPMLWNSALRMAEAGHLVIVQMEAESAQDATRRFTSHLDRPADHLLLASCWQELDRNDADRPFARYQWER